MGRLMACARQVPGGTVAPRTDRNVPLGGGRPADPSGRARSSLPPRGRLPRPADRGRPPHTDMDFFKGCALAGTLGCLGLLALSLAPAAIMVLGHLMN